MPACRLAPAAAIICQGAGFAANPPHCAGNRRTGASYGPCRPRYNRLSRTPWSRGRAGAISVLIDWIVWLVALARPENLERVGQPGRRLVGELRDSGRDHLQRDRFAGRVFSAGRFAACSRPAFCRASKAEVFNIWILGRALIMAAILGDALNYFVGLQMGEYVFDAAGCGLSNTTTCWRPRRFTSGMAARPSCWPDSCRWCRTFTPFVAGVARMGYRRFALYNMAGGVGWVVSMLAAGYFLGQHPWVQTHFEQVVIGIVLVSVLPVAVSAGRHWLAARGAQNRPRRRRSLNAAGSLAPPAGMCRKSLIGSCRLIRHAASHPGSLADRLTGQ